MGGASVDANVGEGIGVGGASVDASVGDSSRVGDTAVARAIMAVGSTTAVASLAEGKGGSQANRLPAITHRATFVTNCLAIRFARIS